ncbi:MAG: cytochrome c-type biogenesis protein CcmH [Acidimicrobiia bacterium]|nr:cytochrome c-type biogenesis protein CcmH [Acidimicrobiia bacterium]NNC75127.1 cytochrome c-type biogenesis protein CcmH [Acidimicrobiia bacterium]
MSDTRSSWISAVGWALAAAALVVMVVGLWPRATPLTAIDRVEALASSIRCPLCGGESIADAPSQVARDLEAVIAEKVGAGESDDQIRNFFVARFGEVALLDPPLDGWGIALWAIPIAGLVFGVAAVSGRLRPEEGR